MSAERPSLLEAVPTEQVPFEVVIRARQRGFDTVYTVYLRDEDGNRMDSTSTLDRATAFSRASEWMERLPQRTMETARRV